jgi:hypothetical protein
MMASLSRVLAHSRQKSHAEFDLFQSITHAAGGSARTLHSEHSREATPGVARHLGENRMHRALRQPHLMPPLPVSHPHFRGNGGIALVGQRPLALLFGVEPGTLGACTMVKHHFRTGHGFNLWCAE